MSSAIQAIQRRPPTREEIYRMQRDYQYAVKPWSDMLCDIEKRSLHALILFPDGHIERQERYSPEDFVSRHEIRQVIKQLQRQIFGVTHE